MAVTPHPKDSNGTALQAKVTSLQANPVTSTLAKAQVAAALDQAQRELVDHYLNVGRITAANILSTLS